MSADNLKLSIIIVNWNGVHLLEKCLSSVIEETKGIEYEIILVDNASTDGSTDFVENNFPNVILVKNTENYGFAHGNNQGIEMARGEYLLLLNSDTVTLNSALTKCLSRMEDDKTIGVLGCKLLNSDGTLQPSCYNFNSILNAALFKTKLIKFVPLEKRYKYESLITTVSHEKEIDADYVCGAFMLLRKEVTKQVGLLDESFFMYAEEADFCMRIKKMGYSILYYPGAEIIHLGGGSSKKISSISQNRRIISRLKLLRKHKGSLYYYMYKTLSLINVCLAITVSLLKRSSENRKASVSKLKAILSMKYV